MQAARGFTLVELLVAIAVMALLAIASWRGLDGMARSQQLTRERTRNAEARRFTMDFFHAAGMKMTDSQANFIWVDLDRPAKGFRDACEKQGVLVGREFPPFERTHCRISIGTMDEMKRALTVFRAVLGAAVSTEAGGRG